MAAERMTAGQIVYSALVWAEESMDQMIAGCHPEDPYRAEISEQRRQLRAYRLKRFGKERSPFEGMKTYSLDELRELATKPEQ